jgi:hypothetical protein
MLSSRSRALIGGASALGISLLGVLPAAMPASAGTGVPHSWAGHHRVMYDVGVHSNVTRSQAMKAALATSTFTQFKAKVTVGTKSYTYVMAGKNPAVKTSSPSATIKVELVPLIIKFSNGDTWNPTKTDSCDSGASAMSRVQQSPIFVAQNRTWGGTSIGNTQVTDAFQRAEFWKYAKPSGINPGYHVVLSKTTVSPVTLNVPNADSAVETAIACGNGLLGGVEINWLDNQLQKNVIPNVSGASPSTLPVFILHNVVEYITSPGNCCVLGYHNAFSRTSGVQTYGVSEYDNSKAFGTAVRDISALSHEVGEWQDDPYTNNPTPAWGHIGQVSGCQSNLEVGDPLSGTTFNDTVSNFTYHPQELAFFSWFYHQSPSLGVNGWYSDRGTFKSPAKTCT